MAHVSQMPCDGDGVCMLCKVKPPEEEKLTCKTCSTPWHANCLTVRPETLESTLQWECPDCRMPVDGGGGALLPSSGKCGNAGGDDVSGQLIYAIREIEADASLTELEKAKKRQELLSGRAKSEDDNGEPSEKEGKGKGKEKVDDGSDVLKVVETIFNCSFCMQLPERPVTTPCGHNFCLKCFQKWISQGKNTCAKCRRTIPSQMARQPRINSLLVTTIRTAKMSKSNDSIDHDMLQYFVHNQNRPDKAYTTERAKKAGKANAASGKIFVTVPPDHFGPILAENDPVRNRGVLVGDWWEDRLTCRQWGAHLPHVSGISGQSKYGAQSVVLSGGYQDDEDHGEWFLYTGSGGRDLSGNKRTNKEQSFDQKFEKSNESLRVSCIKGYPVRVIRSCKEKRSSYAPEEGVRYDGIYRIEKCWFKVGKQGFKVCRYLFVRCDNSPAPWTSDLHGDKVRALPVISELKRATDIIKRTESPSWDYDEHEGVWRWKKPPPPSKKGTTKSCPQDGKQERGAIIRKKAQDTSLERLLEGFACSICKKVMTLPLTTPCGHNFCKACLEGAFAGQALVRERKCVGGRTLRSQKNVMKCPTCTIDISEFLANPQVNRELMDVIERLQSKTKEGGDNVEGTEKKASDSVEEKPDFSAGSEDEEASESMEEMPHSSSGSEENDLPLPQAGDKRKREEKKEASLPTEEKSGKMSKRKKIDAED